MSQGHAPSIVPSEPDLVAFISSCMGDDESALREEIVEAVRSVPGFRDWAFEFSPPSPRDAIGDYEQRAAAADLLVFVALNRITANVQREVRIALQHEVPVIALDLSTTSVDPEVVEFFRELASDVKYYRMRSSDRISDILGTAISDEIKRRWREGKHLSRRLMLKWFRRESDVRILDALITAGVTDDVAQRILDDDYAGDRDIDLPLPLAVVTGDVGTGKSLFGERWLRKAIRNALVQRYAPTPIFVYARSDHGRNLEDYVRTRLQAAGAAAFESGICLFVDGLDEAGPEASQELLAAARRVVRLYSNSSALISSRPSAVLTAAKASTVELAPLTPDNAAALIALVSGREMAPYQFHSHNETIRETLQRPLFAIIYGSRLRLGVEGRVHATELIDWLIESGLTRIETDKAAANKRLRSLALALIRNGWQAAPSAEIGGRVAVAELLATRLVRETQEGVSFGLPALVDWFAASAIANRDLEIVEILANPDSVIRWRYALAVAIVQSSHPRADQILETLVRSYTPFCAEIITEALDQYADAPRPDLPSAADVAASLSKAERVFREAVGPLAAFSRLLRGGLPMSYDVVVDGRLIEITYFRPEETERTPDRAIRSRGRGLIDSRTGWAWRFALDDVRRDIKTAIEEKAFFLGSRGAPDERLWNAVRTYSDADFGGVSVEGLLEELELAGSPDEAILISPFAISRILKSADGYTVGELKEVLRVLSAAGIRTLRAPYPEFNIEAVRHEEPIRRPEVLLSRTRAIYENALRIYVQLVERWFPALIGGLNLHNLLPVKIELTLRQWVMGHVIGGLIVILPMKCTNGESEVITKYEPGLIDPQFERGLEWVGICRERRPLVFRPTPISSFGRIEIAADEPATDIAYDWLKNDLKALGWLE